MLNKIAKVVEIAVIVGLSGFMLGCKGPEFVEDEDGNLLGIKLHLPRELIADCEYKRWQFINLEKKSVLEERFSTEEKFHEWCEEQKCFYNNDLNSYRSYALMFKIVNEKNYLIPGDFCERIELGKILTHIHRKGAIDWNYDSINDPIELYLANLDEIMDSD